MFKKKISLGLGFTILFIISAVVYSIGYKIAINKFNSLISFAQEKQKTYQNLSEIDYYIKNEYIGNLNENDILESINKGYINGINDENCKFMNRQEYNDYIKNEKNIKQEISWDILDNNLGYLFCKDLGKGSSDIFLETIKSNFIQKGIKKIILDLRLSEKGNIDEIFKILENILPNGEIISKLDKNNKKDLICQSNIDGLDLKFSILINENCSSMAEVLTAGLKYSNLETVIVGQNTKGNFLTEKTIEISQNSIIIFPNAKYIIFDKDLYKKGIAPDYKFDVSENEINLLKEEKLSYAKDSQLQYAISKFNS